MGIAREPDLGIYEFTADDLKSNGRGFITPGQKAGLQATGHGIRSCSTTSALVAISFVGIAWIVLLALMLRNQDMREAILGTPYIPAVGGSLLLGAVLIGLSVLLARRRAAQLEEAPLQTVEGQTRFDTSYSPNSGLTTYYVFVGERRFSFGQEMSHVFREGQAYRVYFAKVGVYEMILSLERLAT